MKVSPDIVSFFPPGLTPRPAQVDAMRQVQAAWADYDVFVLSRPPAFGKTEEAYALAHWLAAQGVTTNYLVPDNVLVRQAADRYPRFAVLYRKDMYACQHPHSVDPDLADSCTRNAHRAARERAKASRARLMNTHVYRANRMYAQVAIFDEAHKIRDLLDEPPVRIWRHDYRFPDGLGTVADVIAWGQGHLRQDPTDERLRDLLMHIARVRDYSTVEYCSRRFRGKPMPVLEISACLARLATRRLWPSSVQKIVLMSGTIGPKDIEELGLQHRRVVYLHGDSPIPPAQRPLVYRPTCHMSERYMQHSLPLFAKAVLATLEQEPGKGLIHLPYGLTARLREILQHPRLMWHTQRDKRDVLQAFAAQPAESGAVLVCSGLYEGIDLPFDDDSWQVIGKVPYLSLGDEAIKQKLAQDPDWYDWQAIKRLVQAYGRLPRRPDGRGTTYIFDINFKRLKQVDERRAVRMFPAHFTAAIGGRAS